MLTQPLFRLAVVVLLGRQLLKPKHKTVVLSLRRRAFYERFALLPSVLREGSQ